MGLNILSLWKGIFDGFVNSVILNFGNEICSSVLRDSRSSTSPVTTHCFGEFAFAMETVPFGMGNDVSNWYTCSGRSEAFGDERAHISNLLEWFIL